MTSANNLFPIEFVWQNLKGECDSPLSLRFCHTNSMGSQLFALVITREYNELSTSNFVRILP